MKEFSGAINPHADDLVKYQRAVAENLNIVYGTTVRKTAGAVRSSGMDRDLAGDTPQKHGHRITTDKGVWTAEHLIVATGYRVKDEPECATSPESMPDVPWDFYTSVVGRRDEMNMRCVLCECAGTCDVLQPYSCSRW